MTSTSVSTRHGDTRTDSQLIRVERLIELQRGRLPRDRGVHTRPIHLLRAETVFSHGAIQREPPRRLPEQRQRRRGRGVDVRTHAAALRHRDRVRRREGRGRGAGEVGDRGVDRVCRDGGEGGAGGEGGQGGGDGGEGGDGEHGVLEGKVLARGREAGEADGGGEGEGEGVGVGGAPDAGAGVGGGD